MTTVTLRGTKGSPLTNAEVDANFNNLNSYKVEQSSTTGSAYLPSGTTAQRTGSSVAGEVRYNTSTQKFEGFGSAWGNLGGGAAIGDTAPSNPGTGDLWWNSLDGHLYVYYGSIWVDAFAGGEGQYLPLTGGTVSGSLTVNAVGAGITLKQSATGAATYYVMDNTVESGGKRWRLGYSGISSISTFSLLNVTDNVMGFVVDAAGNLGIGTPTPGSKLQVQGAATFVGSSATNNAEIRIQSTDSGGATWRIGDGIATANGNLAVFRSNGSILGTVLDASGNLGLGVTPSAWSSFARAFSLGSSGSGIQGSIANSGATNAISLISNAYYNAGWKYVYSGSSYPAGRYDVEGNQHSWYTAGSGTAGNAISFGDPKMLLDASGNLGIGTTSAVSIAKLTVSNTTTTDNNRLGVAASTYLSGPSYTATFLQQGDSATTGTSCGLSNANLGSIYFQNTSAGLIYTNGGAPIVFATSSTERVRITSDGNLLVGDTAFSYGYNGRLFARNDVNTTPVAATINKIASGNVYGIINSFLSNGNNTSSYHFSGVTQGVAQWYLYGNGTSSFTSDERKKKNIETTRNGYLEDLCKLRVVKYNWWTDDDGTPKELGLIAQEVEQIFPGLITNAIHPDVDGETYKVMKGSVIPFMLLKAIQELSSQVSDLKAKLNELKQRIK